MVTSLCIPIAMSAFSPMTLLDSPRSLVPPTAFGLVGITLTFLLTRPTLAWLPAAAWSGGIAWLLAEAAPWRSYHWLYEDGPFEGFGFSPFGWVTAFLGGLIVAVASVRSRPTCRRGESTARDLASVFA